MENEERIPVKAKKVWETPEIIDLDLDKTESGTILDGAEDVYTDPPS